MSGPAYGRYQVAEAPSSLLTMHVHDGLVPLKEVSHEPKMAVLDQSDLIAQGIDVSSFIPGAPKRVDSLGSCTAQATTVALSNVLDIAAFAEWIYGTQTPATGSVYTDTKGGEEAAIRFYHACTYQTGSPSQEWPPTDCGSSGPYIVSELKKQKLVKGATVVHGATNIVSLMQHAGLLMGSPWLYAWEEPGADGCVDGDGKTSTLEKQIQGGVAGGHETFVFAVRKLVLLPSGLVDPHKTILGGRNSWSKGWGDQGDYLIHLSTLVTLGAYIDLRQLVK